jgi:hypothetical protein
MAKRSPDIEEYMPIKFNEKVLNPTDQDITESIIESGLNTNTENNKVIAN